MLTVLLLGSAVFAACDSGNAVAPADNRAVAVGPSMAAFPDDALFAEDEIESLIERSQELRRGANGDTVVVVPLVFDPNGYLYSPLGFNLLLNNVLNAQGAEGTSDGTLGTTYFTDRETFEAVVASGGSSQGMYSDKLGPPAKPTETSTTYVQHLDPYSCKDKPADCATPSPASPPPTSPPGRGGGNAAPSFSGIPVWPQVWKADIISGSTESTNPFGHDAIVTQLSSGGDTGGLFMDYATRGMEAKMEGSNSEEVIERSVRTYWMDESDPVDVRLMWDPQATTAQRNTAVSYARAQDPDTYWLGSKITRHQWYCSKLVWRSYRRATGDDLDHDEGYYVYPRDIHYSGHVLTFYRFQQNG